MWWQVLASIYNDMWLYPGGPCWSENSLTGRQDRWQSEAELSLLVCTQKKHSRRMNFLKQQQSGQLVSSPILMGVKKKRKKRNSVEMMCSQAARLSPVSLSSWAEQWTSCCQSAFARLQHSETILNSLLCLKQTLTGNRAQIAVSCLNTFIHEHDMKVTLSSTKTCEDESRRSVGTDKTMMTSSRDQHFINLWHDGKQVTGTDYRLNKLFNSKQ